MLTMMETRKKCKIDGNLYKVSFIFPPKKKESQKET